MSGEKIRHISLLFIVGALAFSSIVGSVQFGFNPNRILGLLGNISVWLCMLILLNIPRQKTDLKVVLAKLLVVVAIFQAVLTAAAELIYPARLPFPLLQVVASSMPSGVAAFAYNKLYYYDWLGGAAFRSAGTMANPTWAGAVAAAAMFACIFVIKLSVKWRLLALAGFVSALYSIDMSLSRSVMYAVAGAVAICIVENVRHRQPMFGLWLWTACVTAGVLMVTLWYQAILLWIESVNGERAGSAQSRGEIYSRTLSYIEDLPIPLLGFGVKPQEENLAASIASHSTYLGLIFRCGLIGLTAFILFLAAGLRSALVRRDALGFGVLSFVAIWCILEDFDGGHLLPLAAVMALLSVVARPRPSGSQDSFESTTAEIN
ncbi:O-antigen ligase family protein [Rhodococcus sp. BP-252]|uniref:O-antigen ligase family protein n=1 Tax=unclassified Rhodococcus (in: high G+C Gram-positive bacteria) TaxID=192944 RepID=UPI001C9BA269|nr:MULTISPECIES: O-antigen ligase family protein [unclassified Rhodococcus (in: high G+C Gram-positive bacteria)]MBY6414875.1 O-antigen ligase family protein [Rhodococcus sp. BP-320]MBY6419839.1 O-antigen ligase family protein [Rhodococcus sp. BP-321]MBY6424172.1 O-antigen ligase family protein [Rhodococcus sp. BP-324]MBY6429774.1 O-antigen ligase family protein [Rhodococcus sp. BP-323]MBY6434732.1 O-antigen ligase family protein [Rhodococcus sp. BP-322]